MATKLFLDPSILFTMAPKPEFITPRDTAVHYLGHTIPYNAIWPPFRQLCPLCVKEKGYIEQSWALMAVAACPRHATLLIWRCQCCGRDLSTRKATRALVGPRTCRCGADLASAALQPAPCGAVQIAGVILERLGFLGEAPTFLSAHPRLRDMPLRDILELSHWFARSQRRNPTVYEMPELMDAFYWMLATISDMNDIPGYSSMPVRTFETAGIPSTLAIRLTNAAKKFDARAAGNTVISALSLSVQTSTQNLPMSVLELMEMHLAAGRPTLCNVPDLRPGDLFFLITDLFESIATFFRESTKFTMTSQEWGRLRGMSDEAARRWVVWDNIPRHHIRIGIHRMIMVSWT